MIAHRILFLGGFLASVTASMAADGRVSRTPPPVFSQSLEPLLTPLEAAKRLPKSAALRKEGPVVDILLREMLVHVEEDGRQVAASHEIINILNKDAVDLYREDQNDFSADMERMYLVLARTLREDGTVIPVEGDAAFIKRSESDRDMHSDSEDLHVIYPDVSPGSIVEKIVVRERFRPHLPGEFVHQSIWTGLGPIRRIRLVVDLPEAMAARLRTQGFGFKQPTPLKEPAGPGRVRWTWQTDAAPPSDYETGGPPLAQTGPALRLTTLKDWDAFGQWFVTLVRDRSEVTPELKKLAAQWADDARTPRAIAAALFSRVSNDVRYTGLEFGKGSYQPRVPMEIATTRYGDCKDKSHLLRLLLREHGISSRIALLNTRHSGAIDKEIPSPGRFDHAILAVDFDGEPVPFFCDPTIEQADFGTLAAGDTARDALLIAEEGKTFWTTTPAQTLGHHETTFDLALEPGGGLSGWVTLKTEGLHAARLRRSVANVDRAAVIKQLEQRWLNALRATVIDFEIVNPKDSKAQAGCQVRAYVVRGGVAVDAKGGSERVTFPLMGIVAPQLGEKAERRTPVTSFLWNTKVTGTFSLPPEWKVLDTPEAFTKELEGWDCRLAWEVGKRTITCRSLSNMTTMVIQPAAHHALWQAQRNLIEWLQNPVLLKREAANAAVGKKKIIVDPDDLADEEGAAATPWTPPPGSLPAMPTPEGQIALVDKRFPMDPHNPLEGDHDGRREASKRMLQLFPESHLVAFEAGVRIAFADALDGELDDIPARIRSIIAEHGPHADPQRVIAAQSMLAGTLFDLGETEEALPLAAAVAENPQALPIIRQTGAFIAGASLEKTEPARALEFARQVLEKPSPMELMAVPSAVLAMTSLARLPETKPQDLVAEWESILRKQPAHREALKNAVLLGPETLLDSAHVDAAERLDAALRNHAESGGYSDEQKEELTRVHEVISEARTNAPLHERVRAWLKEHPWPDADKVEPDDEVDTVEDCGNAQNEHYVNYPVSFRYALRLLTHYGPQPDFADHAESAARAAQSWLRAASEGGEDTPKPPVELEAALDMLVQAWADTPGDEDAPHDAASFRGTVIQRRSGPTAAVAHYRALAADSKSPEDVRASAHQDAAWALGELKDYPAMLAEWRALEAWPALRSNAPFQVRGAYLSLAMGQQEEAWHFLEFVARSDPEHSKYILSEKLHADLRWMVENRKAAEAWWTRSKAWWPEWQALVKQTGIAVPEDLPILLPFDDSEDVVAEAKKLRSDAMDDEPDNSLDRSSYHSHLHEGMLLARWHRAHARESVRLLRDHIAPAFPKQAKAARALATRIEKEAAGK